MNKRVEHRQFGKGTIVEKTDSVITIKFDNYEECKQLVFPFAFEGLTKMCEPAAQKRVDAKLEQISNEMEERHRQREEERERLLEEERRLKQAAARKRAQKKRKEKKST